VRVRDATVRVAPGSTITFAPKARRRAIIWLEGSRGTPTELILEGTADQPIIVRSAEGAAPGAIIVPTASTRPREGGGPVLLPQGSVTATHVRFERVGSGSGADRSRDMGGAAIGLQLTAPQAGLSLRDCTFRHCGPVVVNFASDPCAAEVVGCDFADAAGESALEFFGTGSGSKTLRGNRFDTKVSCLVGRTEFAENVLVGPTAMLHLGEKGSEGSAVRANFVHNTSAEDNQSTCLVCAEDGAPIENNIFIGGTWVVRRGSRVMRGNVFKGVGDLHSPTLGSKTTTHQLIANLPPAAVVEDNLLIGPAYALVATSTGCRDLTIRGNILDGTGASGRAVHLNLLAREPVGARIVGNLFIGFTRGVIHDEARNKQAIAQSAANIFAEVPAERYTVTGEDWGADDVVLDSRAELRFSSAEPIDWDELIKALATGELSITEARARIAAHYDVSADSPWFAAGEER
jgi:hypothetical protein